MQVGLLGLVGGSVMGLLRKTQDAVSRGMESSSSPPPS